MPSCTVRTYTKIGARNTDCGCSTSNHPDPLVKTLNFNDELLALYEGELVLSGNIPDETPASAALTIQACSDETCLQPEKLHFTIW